MKPRPAQLRVVATEFLRQRPLVTLPAMIVNLAVSAAGGASRARLVALAVGFSGLQLMFWVERAIGARRPLSERAFARSLIVTTIVLAIGCVATGGLASPLVPLLLAPTGIGFAAFGRARASAALLALLLAICAALVAWPRETPFPLLGSPYREIAAAVCIACSAVLLRLGVAALAEAHAGAADTLARAGDDAAWAAAQRGRELDRLGARVAHEVKNPLAAIRGLVEVMIESKTSGDRDHQRLSVVAGEVARIERILREYLDEHRPAAELERSEVDVAELVRDVAAVLEARASRDHVSLVVQGGPARARIDARRLKEAILNLALNALAASKPADRVELRCTARGRLTIAIADTGCGMTSAELARVGTPGYTTRPGGTGLGVVLARRIVEQHGGTLTFTSAPGRGTTAQIELPEVT